MSYVVEAVPLRRDQANPNLTDHRGYQYRESGPTKGFWGCNGQQEMAHICHLYRASRVSERLNTYHYRVLRRSRLETQMRTPIALPDGFPDMVAEDISQSCGDLTTCDNWRRENISAPSIEG